jgi:glycosyltransferase involved in cell wall biosynthesis
MLSQSLIRSWRPVVLCSSAGWLTEECQRRGIESLIVPFPRSRSVLARLYGNSQFVRFVQRKLGDVGVRPSIVHANDHWEGILGVRLAEALSARSVLFLRTSRLTREEYFKYSCDHYESVAAVGPALQARVQAWAPNQKIHMIYDGLERDEFLPPKKKANGAPRRTLVIGAERPSKGWADLVEALIILEQRGLHFFDQVDFTGDKPSKAENELKLSRVKSVQFRFLGRIDEFRDLVREYDLVINPSRSDSFGMAAIETLAAGVPVLTSRTGVLEQVIPLDHMLFPPKQPRALAEAIERLMNGWDQLDLGVARAQELVLRRFPIEKPAMEVDNLYRRLISGSSAR